MSFDAFELAGDIANNRQSWQNQDSAWFAEYPANAFLRDSVH